MQLTYALPMAIAIAAQFIPQAMAAEPFKPTPVAAPVSIMAGYEDLFVSGGSRVKEEENKSEYAVDQFIALSFERSWTSDAPAWRKLKSYFEYGPGPVGSIWTQDGESLLFFGSNATYAYNVTAGEWSNTTLTFPYAAMDGGTVTAKGLIYGIEGSSTAATRNGTWRFTELNATSNTYNYTYTEQRGRPNPSSWTDMVYSSINDTIFAYEHVDLENGQSLLSFNLTSKTWAPVNATGDIPPARKASCFVSSQDGTVLILAGGSTFGSTPLDDVYSFDVDKSVWTKLPNAPRPASGPVCTVWSQQLIYWGGVGKDGMNEQGPAVLNLTSKTWGTTFTPFGVPPTPSSADRAHLSLSNIGLAMVTMISIAVSTLL